jgi:hypothetical protein
MRPPISAASERTKGFNVCLHCPMHMTSNGHISASSLVSLLVSLTLRVLVPWFISYFYLSKVIVDLSTVLCSLTMDNFWRLVVRVPLRQATSEKDPTHFTDDSRHIFVWSLSDRRLLQRWYPDQGPITVLRWLSVPQWPSSSLLMSAGTDGTVALWTKTNVTKTVTGNTFFLADFYRMCSL